MPIDRKRLMRSLVWAGVVTAVALGYPLHGASLTDDYKDYPEGELGSIRDHLDPPLVLAPPDPTLCPGATHVAYRFSGVSDDGEKGSTTRKKATSIHCTNIDPLLDVTVKVQLFQYNGTDVFEGCVTMPPNQTFTFSTQNTTVYFDDALLGGGGGTDAIFQGTGRILIDQGNVICTAQVLDPLNNPPIFVTGLEMVR